MAITDQNTAHDDTRFGRLVERQDNEDFPYYDGDPVEIPTWKWLVIIASCVVGFVVLTLLPQPDNIVALVPRILFPAIMLATFISMTGAYWKAIFRRLRLRDVWTILGFMLLDIVVTFAIAIVVRSFAGATANSATDGLGKAGAADTVAFYVGTGLQIFGEELFSILPLLAVLYWLHHKARLSRKSAMVLASLVSAVWFGAAHLPTYDWNFAQCFLVIGVARLVLNLAYYRTKNILIPTGAHVLNDWVEFTFTSVAGATGVALIF
ncbi:type II CAAX endopeptidase family protein [Terrabacter sp. NPDC000476]|uniref:CPBP family intramembrane glutamic endopeptidase n=1 Tax=Terrabacter sp. NPDC000476 TaxID=3154258 RepID=UPI0033185418